MADLDLFLSIAEIAGVFLGFAALVSIVNRSTGEKKENLKFSLTNMVFLSLLVVAGSLFPIVLIHYEFAARLVWGVSAGALFLLNGVIFFYLSGFASGWKKAHANAPIISYTAWCLEPLFQIPLVICMLGFFEEYLLALYMTSLVAILPQPALILANVVVTVVSEEDV